LILQMNVLIKKGFLLVHACNLLLNIFRDLRHNISGKYFLQNSYKNIWYIAHEI